MDRNRPREEDLADLRWRAYCDHLEDLGYDLAGGEAPEALAISAVQTRTSADHGAVWGPMSGPSTTSLPSSNLFSSRHIDRSPPRS